MDPQVDHPQEDLVEVQPQMRQLVRSQGWALLKTHSQKSVKHRESEKAKALRAGAFNDALLNQGWIDGIEYLMQAAEKMSQHKKDEQIPTY